MLSQVARMFPKLWNASSFSPLTHLLDHRAWLWSLHAFLKQEPVSELQEYSPLKDLRVLLVEILISLLRKIPNFWGPNQSNWSWMLISEIAMLVPSLCPSHIFQTSVIFFFFCSISPGIFPSVTIMYFREVGKCSSAGIFKERTRKKCEGQGSSVIVLQQT